MARLLLLLSLYVEQTMLAAGSYACMHGIALVYISRTAVQHAAIIQPWNTYVCVFAQCDRVIIYKGIIVEKPDEELIVEIKNSSNLKYELRHHGSTYL